MNTRFKHSFKNETCKTEQTCQLKIHFVIKLCFRSAQLILQTKTTGSVLYVTKGRRFIENYNVCLYINNSIFNLYYTFFFI